MHDGITVKLGAEPFVVPPLTLKQLKKHKEALTRLRSLGDIPTPEQVDDLIQVTHSALVRNYPDMTPDRLEDLVDVVNLGPLFFAIMGQSGFTKKPAGQDGEAGEMAP